MGKSFSKKKKSWEKEDFVGKIWRFGGIKPIITNSTSAEG
jgi:hypothetical protein